MHGSSKAAGRREGASPWVTAERPVAFPSAFALPTARAAFLGSSGCRRAGQPWRAASTLIWTSLSQELYGNFYCKIAGLVLQNPPNRAAISMGNAEIHVQRTATVSPAIHTARPSVAYITRIGGRPGAAAHALAGASPRLAPAHCVASTFGADSQPRTPCEAREGQKKIAKSRAATGCKLIPCRACQWLEPRQGSGLG
jgi:hypothetical protein